MTNIENSGSAAPKRAGVRRPVKLNCKIDMTPMVDLGFLLISFFVITTELSKPVAMNLNMPADGTGSEIGESSVMTILPTSGNHLYYYFGKWEDALKNSAIYSADYAGDLSIRNAISRKQQAMDNDPKCRDKRKGLMLLIKPTAGASYKNVVDLLDETAVTQVKIYALIKVTPAEQEWTAANTNNP